MTNCLEEMRGHLPHDSYNLFNSHQIIQIYMFNSTALGETLAAHRVIHMRMEETMKTGLHILLSKGTLCKLCHFKISILQRLIHFQKT